MDLSGNTASKGHMFECIANYQRELWENAQREMTNLRTVHDKTVHIPQDSTCVYATPITHKHTHKMSRITSKVCEYRWAVSHYTQNGTELIVYVICNVRVMCVMCDV